jgi:hypothetical protein
MARGRRDDAWRDEGQQIRCIVSGFTAQPSGDLAHPGPSGSLQNLSDSFFQGGAIGGHPSRFSSLGSRVRAMWNVLSPEVLEPIRRQLGVAPRVLDGLVAEPSLQRSRIMTTVLTMWQQKLHGLVARRIHSRLGRSMACRAARKQKAPLGGRGLKFWESHKQRRVSSPPGLKFGRQPLIRTKR